MRIAIVGAGGVGGYFGGRLAAAGADITFLARGAHLSAMRADGLRIESELGDARVSVRAEDDPAAIGPVDLVILAVKLWDTADAVRQIAPFVSAETAVLSLQNGVAKDDILRAAFGADRTIGALCYIGAVIAGPGVIKHSGTVQRIVVGEFDGLTSTRVEAFADLCRRAAIDVAVEQHHPTRDLGKIRVPRRAQRCDVRNPAADRPNSCQRAGPGLPRFDLRRSDRGRSCPRHRFCR